MSSTFIPRYRVRRSSIQYWVRMSLTPVEVCSASIGARTPRQARRTCCCKTRRVSVEDRGFPAYDHNQRTCHQREKWGETNKEELVISCIRFLFSGGATVVALAAVMVSPGTDMACRLALHWIIRAICIQGHTGFCTLPSCSVVDLDWFCVC